MRVASLPLIRMPVYPMPLPASEFITIEGAWFKNEGKILSQV
jgi:hypothetical protein